MQRYLNEGLLVCSFDLDLIEVALSECEVGKKYAEDGCPNVALGTPCEPCQFRKLELLLFYLVGQACEALDNLLDLVVEVVDRGDSHV